VDKLLILDQMRDKRFEFVVAFQVKDKEARKIGKRVGIVQIRCAAQKLKNTLKRREQRPVNLKAISARRLDHKMQVIGLQGRLNGILVTAHIR